jgi:CHAT domain-containing protein
VTSLTTLRAMPAATAGRKPFIGFGDPWFSKAEAAQALAEQAAPPQQLAVATRGAPVHLRSAPNTEGVDTAELAELPRLPDTADEVKEIAVTLKADPAKDVYLGAQANEQVVRTVDLDDRRVIMFATHGLVPGDLDGLTEPALALSAPDVAQVPGDGLLTVSKILGLRLNADWVVLSACNTAAGNGAGAEAVSGLGLAFFYAGSRALLVSNWPVETTSARLLTTELFKREAASPGIARAEALRQAMLSLIDGPGMIDPAAQKPVFSYAHPIFWAPFSLVGDGAPG